MKNTFFLMVMMVAVFLYGCSNGKPTAEKQDKNPVGDTLDFEEDYQEFVKALRRFHPAIHEFTSKETFDGRVKALQEEINENISKRDFIWKLSEVIAMIGCGHSSLGFFNQERDLLKPNEYFPMLTRLINNRLYIIDGLVNNEVVEKGEEVKSINGKSIAEIMEIIYPHIASQAHIKSSKTRMFNAYSTSYLSYALDFPDQFEIQMADQRIVTLEPLIENPPYPPHFSEKHPCQEDFCLNEINEKTALLTLRNFAYYGERTPVFTAFLDDSFDQISTKDYENLIIDVRGNLGGPGDASVHLLRYTLSAPFSFFAESGSGSDHNKALKKPFENNFNGRIFFVMDGFGNSTVGHLASIYKDQDRVIFIGEDLGSNQFCAASQLKLRLPNTGIEFTCAREIYMTAVQEKNTSSVIKPHVAITQTIEDYLGDEDVVLGKALELAKEK